MAEAEKDIRYLAIKSMWEIGRINSLSDCFNFVPITVMAKDIRISLDKLKRATTSTKELSDDHLNRLAALLEIRVVDVLKIMNRKGAKRKSK